MKRKLITWFIFVDGQPKGEAYRGRRWTWIRPNGGKEIYGPKANIEDVRDHVARLCNVWGNAVEFRRDS